MARHITAYLSLLVAFTAACSGSSPAQSPPPSTGAAAPASAQAGRANATKSAYFGDLHMHTSYSMDAALMTNTTPDGAYRYAKGEAIQKSANQTIQLKRPLDFLAVTDHAEYLGTFQLLQNKDSALYTSPVAEQFRSPDRHVQTKAYYEVLADISMAKPRSALVDPASSRTVWNEYSVKAAEHYQPGKFTTFLAFEWTSMPDNCNLHRNVIFGTMTVPDRVFSAFDSQRPEDLWSYLENARKAGADVVSISHNGNISCGRMFALNDSDGRPIDAAYAERRALNEIAHEIIQGKGASETHPSIATNDEFAAFEAAAIQLGVMKPLTGAALGARTSYIREAYKNGLLLDERLGANPFRFGIVAGSDSHVGATQPDEDNFNGFHGDADSTPERRIVKPEALLSYMVGSGGLTGIWAQENTRESLFASLKSKETFGTSGVRIQPRFFAGWALTPAVLRQTDWISTAYRDGVPMGGTLGPRDGTAAPTFIVSALKDAEGANLDRIQIVKGWIKNGQTFDRIYDVALSGNRTVDPKTGKAPPVGNTVDIKTATYTNSIGAAELSAVWTDPDFDPTVRAFYYMRVLEIPTPRWSTRDAAALGIAPRKDVETTIQERAWTSPIWYTPPR